MSKLLPVLMVIAAGLLPACSPKDDPTKPTMEVWKSPTCQCCSKWAQHMRDSGFNVHIHNETALNPLKTKLGVPETLASCHTAQVSGYVIEGHVPAGEIHRFLTEKPIVRGIAVAGMPIGSPGMEMGNQKEPYDVMTFQESGEIAIYAKH